MQGKQRLEPAHTCSNAMLQHKKNSVLSVAWDDGVAGLRKYNVVSSKRNRSPLLLYNACTNKYMPKTHTCC